MKVWSIHESISIPAPVATIGIFDGVHLGHRYILEHLNSLAREHRGESVVVTLWPHPQLVLNQDLQHFNLLHTREEKIRELGRAGVDHLVVIPFTRDISSLTACEFMKNYLVDRLGIRILVLGYDNRFGRDRKGDPDGLALCAEQNSFIIEKIREYNSEHGKVSSTTIRDAILAGDLQTAMEMLGYHYYLSGYIMEGSKLGRRMGFPTANVHPTDPNKLIPMNGVYAIRAELVGKELGGMLNIGFRPTMDSASAVKTIEAHLFDISGDFYGEQIVIHFVRRIRNEMKFGSMDQLKTQLERDEVKVRQILREI
jgi:riboflavin kinase/FMN adenylyltransferase